MSLKLNDIIDLEYLAGRDEELDSEADVQACIDRDRAIFSSMNGVPDTDREALLAGWLDKRRAQESGTLLPGTVFSRLYRMTAYVLAAAGLFSGGSVTISLLAYHGDRPINVSVFILVFVLVPLLFTLAGAVGGMRRHFGGSERAGRGFSFGSALVSAVMFKGLPRLLKRLDWEVMAQKADSVQISAMMIRMRAQFFRGLFYWPVFILTGLFSMGFSAGALGATFFRVMVSDLAFGWQSTLLTSAETVHSLVSWMAWPWASWMPEGAAFPGLAQIEGSRIILKEGISVLATPHLTSWWPFLCMGIAFYGLIPRALLTAAAAVAQNQALARFDFNRRLFNDLIARMQSPVLNVMVDETPGHPANAQKEVMPEDRAPEPMAAKKQMTGQSAVLLVPERVYDEAAVSQVRRKAQKDLFCRVRQTIHIHCNFQEDRPVLETLDPQAADLAILVQEVWQPPIRGLLHYLTQVGDALPDNTDLLVMLTDEAGSRDLGVSPENMDVGIWKKAVLGLGHPKINIKRCRQDDS